LFPDVCVIALVPDPWDVLWQPRHQVVSRLTKYFRTIWCNPADEWRETLKSGRVLSSFERTEEGMMICQPGLLESRIYSPEAASRWAVCRRMKRLYRAAKDTGAKKVVLYLWRPEFHGALDQLPHDVSVYHIDDEYSFSKEYKGIDPVEKQILETVDQVIVHSPDLMAKKGDINPNTANIPNGVDYPYFSAPKDEPSDMADIPHPRIGYLGWIKWQINFKLMRKLAIRHPEQSYVLVGPRGVLRDQEEAFEEMCKLPNVYWLGGKSKEEMPSYIQHFDIAVMPYIISDYTNFIYPLKVHEYFATGVPVVATPIRSLLGFSEELKLADSESEWSSAIDHILRAERDNTELAERRRKLASMHDWGAITASVAGLMCRRLGAEYAERFLAECPDFEEQLKKYR